MRRALPPLQGIVYSCSNDFTVMQWDTSGAFQQMFAGHTNHVRAREYPVCTL